LGVVKGPAADATEAPQRWGLLCNPVMKMISFFFVFPCNGAPVVWNWQGKTEVLGGGGDLSQCHFVHHKSHIDWPGIERNCTYYQVSVTCGKPQFFNTETHYFLFDNLEVSVVEGAQSFPSVAKTRARQVRHVSEGEYINIQNMHLLSQARDSIGEGVLFL
jgi:hypothetical protein